MESQHKSSKVAVFVLCTLLFGGLSIHSLSTSNEAHSAQVKKANQQTAAPVTDCFESRIGYSSVTRVENVDSKYGYPNVKCSQTTGAVLWWSDPFAGTIPMGEMPKIGDITHGDFANAVVKPREPRLIYFNMGPDGCKTCQCV